MPFTADDYDRVFDLTSLLLDHGLDETQAGELDTLLRSGKEARVAYLECVNIHVQLAEHYAPTPTRVVNDRFLAELLDSGSVESGQSPSVNDPVGLSSDSALSSAS